MKELRLRDASASQVRAWALGPGDLASSPGSTCLSSETRYLKSCLDFLTCKVKPITTPPPAPRSDGPAATGTRLRALQAPSRRQAPSEGLLAVTVNPRMPEAAPDPRGEPGTHILSSFCAEWGLYLWDESLQETISLCWFMF